MSRHVKRRYVNHAAVAERLLSQPGNWAEVGDYPSVKGAEDAVRRISTAYQAPMYRPAGAFEARHALTELGARVEARYVGHTRILEDRPVQQAAVVIPPTRDCDRVLGQIARGEVLAGPEGARRIAARHEAAYGEVWVRDAAWADAIAALTTGGAQ